MGFQGASPPFGRPGLLGTTAPLMDTGNCKLDPDVSKGGGPAFETTRDKRHVTTGRKNPMLDLHAASRPSRSPCPYRALVRLARWNPQRRCVDCLNREDAQLTLDRRAWYSTGSEGRSIDLFMTLLLPNWIIGACMGLPLGILLGIWIVTAPIRRRKWRYR